MANLMDFINDFKHVLKVNDRVTLFFVFYISINFIISLLAPSTVILMVIETLMAGFGSSFYPYYISYKSEIITRFSKDLSLLTSYIVTLIPVSIYILICYHLKSEHQVKAAMILGTFFAFVMISMLIGAVANILNSPPLNPSALLLFTIAFVFAMAALLHPREFNCLYTGIIYYLGVPVAFILLNIYAMVNLNNVSWGTRELANTTRGGDYAHVVNSSSDSVDAAVSRRKKILKFLIGENTSAERKRKYSLKKYFLL